MLTSAEAWQAIATHLSPLSEEEVPRRQAAGRVLAHALPARVDVPAAHVSAMDGYALAGPVAPGESRPVAVTIAAGDAPGFTLEPPAVARIMTGAPVPRGADRVVPVEATVASSGREIVTFTLGSGEPGQHIRRRGEIQRAGTGLLPAGALLTPGALSLLATHGHGTLPVHRAPRVAILASGDEVVPPESEPGPGQLRDSHTDFLLAAGASLGLAFTPLGIAPDREAELLPLVERGLESDVLLLCGGVSMGEFDLAEGVLARLGCRAVFDAVAIQPGKPLVFAVHDRGLVFGLPGNPASVMVTFWLFVRPALRRLLGQEDAFWQGALAATLAAPLPGAGARERFLPAEIAIRGGEVFATPAPPKGSHDLAAYARGTALVRVPAGAAPREAGGQCEVLPLGCGPR
ncbi:MAG: molybdopterin molybdotransferase [Acidobacteriota bacterium]|jgi:molybdopterin molybdotransferase|nr:molybdopterin molybdotransferase [Acidobacteriota bacterium]